MPHAQDKLAIFGGSFDPVHNGHLHMASSAVEHHGIQRVLFIPCRISPHKTHTPPTDSRHRLAMLELATRELPWAGIDTLELDRPGPSYSYTTAQTISQQHPHAELHWIMGTDQWGALGTWAHPEILASLVTFIVFHRGTPPEPRDGFRMISIHDEHPASSSAIRQAIAQGSPPPPWLPHDVLAYIQDHQLYQTKNPQP